jgi:hypothetical protein
MLLKNHHTIIIFLVFSFFASLSHSEDQVDTIVYPKDNNIIQYCRDNAFYIKFDVRFSKNLTKIIPFEIELPLPNRLPFKCIIDGPKSNIFCFHSFNNHVWSLSADSRMEIPYSFPYIEGIRWDYDSFLRRIYRYLWRTTENCGLIYSREMRIDGNPVDNVKMVLEVSEISGGKCSASRYDYSFNMKLKLNEGEYVDQLKSAKENKKNYSMKFLNKFYVPVLIGDKRERGTTTFRKDYEYKYAICSYNEEINQNNFDKEDGFNFECHISVSRYIKFKGPLQIKPFTDLNYISSTDTEGKTSINLIQVKFEILASSQTKEPSELRNLKPVNINEINEPNFLILDSNLNIYICPDIPTLTIKNYNEGIQFGGINTSGSKFLFLLYGYLSNGYEYVNGTLTYLDMTKEEIKFYLKVTDNLETDNQKKSVKCTIPSGSSINKNILVEVRCIGPRPPIRTNNNTDLILNWAWEENNYFDDILIRWPYDLTKKKHIFFYDVKGLSVKKSDFGCFENKFFFYLYVYDLKAEPKISFNLPLTYPKDTRAICKLYNSVTFKCIIDLRLKRLAKGDKVIISNEENKYVGNPESNIVLYKVSNDSESSQFNFVIPVEEDCGDFMLVGALKDIGYTYLQVIIIIVCSLVGIALIVFGIAFCIVYEITHRDRKGDFYRHKDEKELPNVSTTQPNVPQPNA